MFPFGSAVPKQLAIIEVAKKVPKADETIVARDIDKYFAKEKLWRQRLAGSKKYISCHVEKRILQYPTVVQDSQNGSKHSTNSGFLWTELQGSQLNQGNEENRRTNECATKLVSLSLSLLYN